MRQIVVDAPVILVRRDAESLWPFHLHGLVEVQEWIHEIHFTAFELRRFRCPLGLVQLEMLEGRDHRRELPVQSICGHLCGFSKHSRQGGNAQLGPSPLHVQIEIAELIRRDHLGFDL